MTKVKQQSKEIYLDGEEYKKEKEQEKKKNSKDKKEKDFEKELDSSDNVKFLLQENLRLNRELKEDLKYVKHYIYWQRVWGFIKVSLIIIPLAIGFFLLPSLLDGVVKQYQDLLGGEIKIDASGLDASQISDIIKKSK